MSGWRQRELAITTAVLDGSPATIITIDGVDLLELQQPLPAPSTRPRPSPQRVVFRPPDPVDLLPPDSLSLLPSALPRPAMAGICSCGTAGCNSLWFQVRRSGGQVIWEPYPSSPRATIDTSYAFDLRQYLDAVDDGHASTRRWETRARLLAREVRRRRDGLFGFPMISRDGPRLVGLRLLQASAWPGHDQIVLTVATPNGVRQLTIPVTDEMTDEQVLQMAHDVDDTRWI